MNPKMDKHERYRTRHKCTRQGMDAGTGDQQAFETGFICPNIEFVGSYVVQFSNTRILMVTFITSNQHSSNRADCEGVTVEGSEPLGFGLGRRRTAYPVRTLATAVAVLLLLSRTALALKRRVTSRSRTGTTCTIFPIRVTTAILSTGTTCWSTTRTRTHRCGNST